ncbi:hypothetical protein [Pseudomonas sp. 18058]|jgi:hypothetical protein|uniref:hypothetical protein n=1 Tax=Pseudomonas sp. 18058 TaxID=2681406 RepID=UPI0013568CF2|nr:hypothetical protein [Pseudomonas sp. 18058]
MVNSLWSRFGLELTLVTFIVFFGLVMCRAHLTYQRGNKKRIDEEFRQTMAQHCIKNVQIKQEHTVLGARRRGGKRPFDVHRILYSPPDRWFVYVHVEDEKPVFLPISEQRAMASATSSGDE